MVATLAVLSDRCVTLSDIVSNGVSENTYLQEGNNYYIHTHTALQTLSLATAQNKLYILENSGLVNYVGHHQTVQFLVAKSFCQGTSY